MRVRRKRRVDGRDGDIVGESILKVAGNYKKNGGSILRFLNVMIRGEGFSIFGK